VTEGVTGTFYDADDPAALAAAVGRSDALTIDPEACRAAAEHFGADRFRAEMRRVVDEAVAAERQPRPGERPMHRGLTNLPPRTRSGRRAA
jgi:hypothetical protein